MQNKRFQNRMAESRWTLLQTLLLSVVVWVLYVLNNLSLSTVAPLVVITVTTFIMAELNNANALIRIYSRMVSCSYVATITMATFLLDNLDAVLVTAAVAVFYMFAFGCYQDTHAPGRIFYAFLAVGLASVLWVHILFFLPILWIVMSTNLLAMSLKNFCASVLGVITPYWFLVAWYVFNDNLSEFFSHFAALVDFQMIANWTVLDLHQIVTAILLLLLAVVGIVHYFNNARQDNIRTRLLYELIVTLNVSSIIFLVLQPQHFSYLYGIVAVNTAPLIGHFVALTHTKWTNRLTIAMMFAIVIITIFNLWGHYLAF